MANLQYILARIEQGARIRVATDFFGQPLVAVPRRWLPGSRRIRLTLEQMDMIEQALRDRRDRRRKPGGRGAGPTKSLSPDRIAAV